MSLRSKLGKGIATVGLAAMALTTVGCSSWGNDIKARGGLIGTHDGDYVAISQSGGRIMDVYILEDVYVQSIDGSDGWRFTDEDENLIFLGGDVKLIRINENNKDELMEQYHEYHMEHESKTYRELYNPPE